MCLGSRMMLLRYRRCGDVSCTEWWVVFFLRCLFITSALHGHRLHRVVYLINRRSSARRSILFTFPILILVRQMILSLPLNYLSFDQRLKYFISDICFFRLFTCNKLIFRNHFPLCVNNVFTFVATIRLIEFNR